MCVLVFEAEDSDKAVDVSPRTRYRRNEQAGAISSLLGRCPLVRELSGILAVELRPCQWKVVRIEPWPSPSFTCSGLHPRAISTLAWVSKVVEDRLPRPPSRGVAVYNT